MEFCFIHKDRPATHFLHVPCAPDKLLYICKECDQNKKSVFEVYAKTSGQQDVKNHRETRYIFTRGPNETFTGIKVSKGLQSAIPEIESLPLLAMYILTDFIGSGQFAFMLYGAFQQDSLNQIPATQKRFEITGLQILQALDRIFKQKQN